MNKKEELTAEGSDRSAAVDEALQYTTYLYLGPDSSTLTNNALYYEAHKLGELSPV